MTQYIVHLYREMRLTFTGIEADTLEAAAAATRDRPTSDADDIEDCEGETLTALVDVAGDDEYEQSRFIDFEQETQRQAAPKLLAALEAVLPYAESEHASLFECWRRDGESISELEAERCGGAIDKATAAGITPAAAARHRPIQKQLTSNGMFHTPGLFRALQNDYRIKGSTRRRAIRIFSEGYGLSHEEAAGLLGGAITSEIDDAAGTITFASRCEEAKEA